MDAAAPDSSSWSWVVPETESDRADVALARALEAGLGGWTGEPSRPSRSQLKRLIEEGRVLLDGEPVKAGARLRAGATVRLEVPPPRPLDVRPEDRPIEVLYEDEHLLVVNKPPGLTVHPSETQVEGTLVNALLHQVRDLSGIGGVLRPGIVHRIDKDTSGALVVSKTDETHRKLVEIFARHDIERVYWALTYGAPPGRAVLDERGDETRIEGNIGRNPKDRKRMAILESGGREAITRFRKLAEYAQPSKRPFASWLRVTLETGRTHQIRVHLTAKGHSLLGDPVYGTPSENQPKWTALPRDVQAAVRALPGQALHARVLGFVHPITGKPLHCEAAPPAALEGLLKTLRGYGPPDGA